MTFGYTYFIPLECTNKQLSLFLKRDERSGGSSIVQRLCLCWADTPHPYVRCLKLLRFDKRRWHEVTEEIEDLALFNLPPGFAVLPLTSKRESFFCAVSNSFTLNCTYWADTPVCPYCKEGRAQRREFDNPAVVFMLCGQTPPLRVLLFNVRQQNCPAF